MSTIESNRGTGRTTRMIEAAKAAQGAGERVLIVAHTVNYAKELAARVGPDVAFTTMAGRDRKTRGSNVTEFVDHFVREHARARRDAAIAEPGATTPRSTVVPTRWSARLPTNRKRKRAQAKSRRRQRLAERRR